MDESQKIRMLAESNFEKGLLCAESVVSALAEYQGVDSKLIAKTATAFCSGMARTCGPCGALTGAVMGISLSLGRDTINDEVSGSYHATQEFVRRFQLEFGAKDCHALLGCDLGTEQGRENFRALGLRKKCVSYTGRAAEIAVQVLTENT